MPLALGDRVDHYVVGARLGGGGMGEVFEAIDTRLHRRVALKVLHRQEAKAHERLLREARAVAALGHPNIVSIFDVGETDGMAYLAMELLEGKTLRAYVGDASVPLERKLEWLRLVARALAAAHERGIVHRDVKPDNVFVRGDGVVKVLDFGIARRTLADGAVVSVTTLTDSDQMTAAALASAIDEAERGPVATLTAEGRVVGTPAYMAPEQMRGDEVDARADQFAWGVVAYELLAGKKPWVRPFSTTEPLPVPPPLRDAAPDVPEEVEVAVLRALCPARGGRFAAMAEIGHVLGSAVAAQRASAPPSDPPPTLESARAAPPRERPLVTIVLALLAIAIAAGAWLVRAGARTPPVSVAATAEARPRTASRMSANPEARAAYEEGTQAVRDASSDAARASFERATVLDPGFAAAHLWRAVLGVELDEVERDHFTQALLLRADLGDRDRALLDDVAPLFAVPPDEAALGQRLDVLAAAPDAASRYVACRVFWDRDEATKALGACRGAILLDPGLTAPRDFEGMALERLDDAAGARVAFDACLAASPRSTDCLSSLLKLELDDGDCAKAEARVREMHAIDPLNDHWPRLLADLLVDTGKGLDAARTAFALYFGRLAPSQRRLLEPRTDFGLAVLAGRFDDARAALARLAVEMRRSSSMIARLELLQSQAALAFEAGTRQEAAAAAQRFLHEATVAGASPTEDELLAAKIILYQAGALPRADFVAWRDEWARTSGVTTYRWFSAYAIVAASSQDPRDAREAVEALGANQPLPIFFRGVEEDRTIGAAFLADGQTERAIPYLRRAARSCWAVHYPFDQTTATLLLARALVATGDSRGACGAYASVARRWGRAAASRSGREATRAMRTLACASE